MALQIFLLDVWGMISALFVGALIYHFGGAFAFEYLVLMFIFLVAGTLVTIIGKEKKEEMGLYEYGRSWQNVVANGLVPVLSLIAGSPAAYFGALSAITADKFSSEIGSLGGDPIFLGDFKKVRRGTSGAVSALGTVAGMIGAEIIAVSAYLLFPGVRLREALLLPFVGVAGNFVDSFAGVLETRGLGTKQTSNILGALAGALLAWLLFLLI